MSLMYSCPEYADDRLSGTIVRTKEGVPVTIRHVASLDEVVCAELGKGNIFQLALHDLDLTPVPLGNINVNRGVAYLSRKPKRRDWRQGLRGNNLNKARVITYDEEERDHFTSAELAQVIKGIYPTLEKCYKRVLKWGETSGSAFSRRFSLVNFDEEVLLFYKTRPVGIARQVGDGVFPFLNDEHHYLQEVLSEDLKNGLA